MAGSPSLSRIVVGVTGASGLPLAHTFLTLLNAREDVETHLILSQAAKHVLAMESDLTPEDFTRLADAVYDPRDIGAPVASGSFRTQAMVIIPASMHTVATVRCGLADSLLTRCADVMIKEQRRLVLVPRETPLSPIHLDNLATLAHLQNVAILPAVLTYYSRPQTIADMETHLCGKILDSLGLENEVYPRWGSQKEAF